MQRTRTKPRRPRPAPAAPRRASPRSQRARRTAPRAVRRAASPAAGSKRSGVPSGDARLVAELQEKLARAEACHRALQDSEARYRVLAEATLVGVYVIRDGRIAYANARAAEIFGYQVEEVLGTPVLDLIAPESRALVAENIRRRAAGEIPSLRYATRGLHKDGRGLEIEVYGSAILYEGRTAILGTVLDRTEETRAVAALARSEANYRALMEQAADGILVAAQDARFLDVNTRLCEMLGYERDELMAVGRHVVPPEESERVPLRWDELLRTGSLHVERRLRCKDGRMLDVEIRANLLEDGRILANFRDITDRKRAQEALRASEARFQAFMENTPSVAFIKDPAGRLVYANRAFYTTLGLEPEQVLNRTAAEVHAPDEVELLAAADREVMATGRTTQSEIVIRHSGGRPVHLLVLKFPVEDPGGRRLLGGVAIDVTQRVDAERALADQKRILQSVLDSMGDGVAVVNEQGEFLVWNPAATRITGLGPVGMPAEWSERYGVFLPEGSTPYPPMDLPLARAMRGEATDGEELLLRNPVHPGGVWVRCTGRPVVDETGALRGGVIVFHETTEARRNLEELARAEAKYRALLEQLPVITYTGALDPLGAILYVSPQLEPLLGYAPQEWVRDPEMWHRCLHPEDRARVQEEFRRWVASGEQRLRIEYRMQSRSGATVWFRDEAVLVRGADGRPAFSQGVLLDITEREVERRGRERLQALSMDLVAVQEAERRRIGLELHDEVGQLLTGLKLQLDALPGLTRAEVKRRLGEVHQLLDETMERVRELSQNLRPSVLDDLGLLPALVSYFRRYSRQTGVQVQFEHCGVERRRFDPEVESAAYRIVQEALTNVARHARVRVVHVECWADEHRLGVQVTDDGPGFDAHAVLAEGRTRGLAGMRERAALLRGRLIVESAPGNGCRLVGELPLGDGRT
jgi:PAS domain S-box-containing protein